MQGLRVVKVGGVCLIIFALLMAGIDIINAFAFNYPMALEGNLPVTIAKVMPYVLLREILTFQSLLPLLLIPGAVGLFYYLRDEAPGAMNVALCFMVVAAIAWVISLMLWPSLNWYIAQGYIEDKYIYHTHVMQMMIGGLTSFFHFYLGVYLKVTALALWAFIISCVGLRHKMLWRWLCWLGIILAIIAWIVLAIHGIWGRPTVVLHSISFFPLAYLWIFLIGINLFYHDEK